MGQVFLTASQVNGERFYVPGGKPRVIAVDDTRLTLRAGKTTTGQSLVKENLPNGSYNKYKVYESPAEITAQSLVNAGQGTTLNAKNYVTLAAAALSNAFAGALKLSKYFTEVATATATSADGVGMNATAGLPVGTVRVIVNTSGVILELWPPTGEKFSTAAIDAAINMPAGKRYNIVVTAAGVWTVADDYTEA